MQYRIFALLLLPLCTAAAERRPPALARAALAQEPLTFEVTADGGATARSSAGAFWTNGAEMQVAAGNDVVGVRMEGAQPGSTLRPEAPTGRLTLYLLGRGESGISRTSPHFERVRFEGVYPGIDVAYYGQGGDVEYDFHVQPGADPGRIVLAFDRPLAISEDGSLSIPTGAGELRQHAPAAFQDGEPIAIRYRRIDERRVGFEIAAHDDTRALVIDPRIGLASFFGGLGSDRIEDVAFDSKGAMWITGDTNSPDFPLPPNGFPQTRRGVSDVFVSKLERQVDAAGAESWRLATTIILGGAGRDRAVGVVVDAQGRVYVMGDTQSRDFPVSNDAEQRDLAAGTDAFVTVLRETDFPFFTLGEEDGAPAQSFTNYEIDYSTLYGGAGEDVAVQGSLAAFTEDSGAPCAILAGQSMSSNLKTTMFSAQPVHGGGTDAFFSAFCRKSGAGYPLTYGTFLGGNREEAGAAIAVSPSGSFCMATRTTSAGLAASGFQRALAGSTDVYLGCFTPVRRRPGLPFLFRELGRTFWGGSGAESLIGLGLQETGPGAEEFRVFVLTESASGDVSQPVPAPATPAGARDVNPGSRSLLVGAFPPALDRRLAQFWLGGRSQEAGGALAVSGECLAVTGKTSSADFPMSATFPERLLVSGEDIVAGKFCFNADMTAATTQYLGALGSSAEDAASALTFGPFGNEYIAGWTTNPGGATPQLAATAGAPQAAFGGGTEDGLLLELYKPRLRPEAVVGAADFLSRPVAPGQIVTLFGLGIGPGVAIGPQLDEAGRLRSSLGGVRVLFDDVAAPMIFVSRNQVSAVAPFFLDVRSSVQVRIETNGAVSEPVTLPVAQAAPAVFTLSQTGSGQAAVLNEDSSVNGETRPAAPGSLLQIFLTGAGQTLPQGVDGELIPIRQPFPQIRSAVEVHVGGVRASVIYAGGAPGQVHGVAQINALTPRGLGANAKTPLEITIGGLSIQPGVTVAISGAP